MSIRGFTKFCIKVLWRLQFLGYFRTLCLKFQKARTKIEVFLTLPSQQGRVRTTSILVRAFWNFKCKVLKYPRNCSLHNTLIPNFGKPLINCDMKALAPLCNVVCIEILVWRGDVQCQNLPTCSCIMTSNRGSDNLIKITSTIPCNFLLHLTLASNRS